jgi:hypothetical protein
MIDVTEVQIGDLYQMAPGQVYLPSDHSESFLGGIINENVVAVALNEADGFPVDQPAHWKRPMGLVFNDVRFEVDESSVARVEQGNRPDIGSLILNAGGLWLYATSEGGTHFVGLRAADRGVRDDALAFSKWRIVRGLKDQPQILFTKS